MVLVANCICACGGGERMVLGWEELCLQGERSNSGTYVEGGRMVVPMGRHVCMNSGTYMDGGTGRTCLHGE